jgi:hypothetical protein
METPWTLFESAADAALDTIWSRFAKEGRESAAFAKLGEYPNASAWLAKSLGMSADYIPRKLGAMLAGWIHNYRYVDLLAEMLDGERKVFREDSLTANSVGEDIMFAATRWTQSREAEVCKSGTDVLAAMLRDALHGTPWNTANWALANLHQATSGHHDVFRELSSARDEQMKGQEFLQKAVRALRQNDKQLLARLVTAPSPRIPLPRNDPDYEIIHSLWEAAAAAEAISE